MSSGLLQKSSTGSPVRRRDDLLLARLRRGALGVGHDELAHVGAREVEPEGPP